MHCSSLFYRISCCSFQLRLCYVNWNSICLEATSSLFNKYYTLHIIWQSLSKFRLAFRRIAIFTAAEDIVVVRHLCLQCKLFDVDVDVKLHFNDTLVIWYFSDKQLQEELALPLLVQWTWRIHNRLRYSISTQSASSYHSSPIMSILERQFRDRISLTYWRCLRNVIYIHVLLVIFQ